MCYFDFLFYHKYNSYSLLFYFSHYFYITIILFFSIDLVVRAAEGIPTSNLNGPINIFFIIYFKNIIHS